MAPKVTPEVHHLFTPTRRNPIPVPRSTHRTPSSMLTPRLGSGEGKRNGEGEHSKHKGKGNNGGNSNGNGNGGGIIKGKGYSIQKLKETEADMKKTETLSVALLGILVQLAGYFMLSQGVIFTAALFNDRGIIKCFLMGLSLLACVT